LYDLWNGGDVDDTLDDVAVTFPGAGKLPAEDFINNLAAIWAGLQATTGQSKYHGHAGNKATVSLTYFRSEIAKMRPG
jgi:hypothetical protein